METIRRMLRRMASLLRLDGTALGDTGQHSDVRGESHADPSRGVH